MIMKQRISKNQIYWLCQVLGWFSLVLVETINYTFVLVGSFQWEYVSAFGIQALYGLLVSHFYKILFIRKSTFEKPVRAIWVKGLADTFNISLIITLIIIGPSIIQSWELMTDQILAVSIEILGRILNQGRYIVVWIIIYYMYKILERNRNILQEKLEMESLLTSTELELLKTQLNPHFLFNALNSIKALVLIDGQLAKDAIIKLSELLQFSLRYEKTPLIQMSEEIYKVEKYLELEKIRFGSRLSYEIEVARDAEGLEVPPALVLTLTENAIKHGITQLPDGGEIKIQVESRENTLLIQVINSGRLKGENLKGIGLKNIRGRLVHLFGKTANLHLQNHLENSVLTTISYPIHAQS
ncbi:hypothetical protein EGN73_08840 [Arthrospiribacter ruber]|uniref:Signal transduction histidine kinase internal region domain-containing protein n=2 Tax=Arthrospiribacter ruber TaxID=2487934 RepID=A0A951MDQ3_9BACT|nr:hypothetical protein [Arthrospiribacter ruber]